MGEKMSEEGGEGKTKTHFDQGKTSEEGGGGKTKCSAEVDSGNSSGPPPSTDYGGTFEGVANYQPPPQSHQVKGFPPAPPPTEYAVSVPHYYPQGYPQGYAVYEEPLPCCGTGIGWFLFIIGFFLGAMPWYVGCGLLLCVRMDPREKVGLAACVIAAILAAPAVTVLVSKVING